MIELFRYKNIEAQTFSYETGDREWEPGVLSEKGVFLTDAEFVAVKRKYFEEGRGTVSYYDEELIEFEEHEAKKERPI